MRIFLVGFNEGFARSVARYVSGDPGVALTGVAPSPVLAAMMLSVTKAELALLDWSVLGASPGETVGALRLGHPGLRIVCVVNEGESYRAAAAHAGADGVISTDGFAEEIGALLRGFFLGRYCT